MKSYQVMYLPIKSSVKTKRMLKGLINQYQKILTNPVITCYKVTRNDSNRIYCHYADESLSIHDNLKILYDASSGFVCSLLKAYQSHRTIIMFFYTDHHHIYLLKRNIKDTYMPIQFLNTNEPEDWKTLKTAEVYLKYQNKFNKA